MRRKLNLKHKSNLLSVAEPWRNFMCWKIIAGKSTPSSRVYNSSEAEMTAKVDGHLLCHWAHWVYLTQVTGHRCLIRMANRLISYTNTQLTFVLSSGGRWPPWDMLSSGRVWNYSLFLSSLSQDRRKFWDRAPTTCTLKVDMQFWFAHGLPSLVRVVSAISWCSSRTNSMRLIDLRMQSRAFAGRSLCGPTTELIKLKVRPHWLSFSKKPGCTC